MLKINDKITKGFIAGLTGGIVMNIVDYIIYLNFDDELYLEWGAIVIFGRLPENILEIIIAQISQLFFAGFLGIVYIYLINKLSSKNHLFTGLIYGIMVWFVIYAISLAFRLPHLTTHSLAAILSNSLGSILYGVTLVLILQRLYSLKK